MRSVLTKLLRATYGAARWIHRRLWCFMETIGTDIAGVVVAGCGHGRVPPSGVHADLSHLNIPTTCSDLPLIHHSLRWISWKSVLRVPLCAHSREVVVRVIANPVNSVVPAVCEYHKKLCLDHCKIVGVTTLDFVRTTSSPPLKGSSMRDAQISVLIGHAGVTIFFPVS